MDIQQLIDDLDKLEEWCFNNERALLGATCTYDADLVSVDFNPKGVLVHLCLSCGQHITTFIDMDVFLEMVDLP